MSSFAPQPRQASSPDRSACDRIQVCIAMAPAAEFRGWISDASCGAGNAASNQAARECAERCIKGGSAPVFVTEKEQNVYKLTNADLAKTVGVSKPSIHHHFPSKENLGIVIVEAYIDRVRSDLARIEAQHNPTLARLEAFLRMFQTSSNSGLLPLCGALAAEMSALPVSLQQITRRIFDLQLQWLCSTHQTIGGGHPRS